MKRFASTALILAIVAVLLTWSQAAAQEDSVGIGSATINVNSSGTVELAAENIGEPGLAAWSIDVVYDPDVVSAVDCLPNDSGVCNPNFAANTVRVTGASASGSEGDTSLASLTFRCLTEGTSPLTVNVNEFADGTLGRPQAIDVTVVHGSINCVTVVQPTATPEEDDVVEEPTPQQPTPAPQIIVSAGTGPGDLGIETWSLVIAGLIGAGIAWLIVGMGGAGLTAVTAGALPWHRSPKPEDSIANVPGADASAVPVFRRSRRRDR